jgi:hypothetical protein
VTFQPGDDVRIQYGAAHAPTRPGIFLLWEERLELEKGRPARFVRYMAGNLYAIVEAEPWHDIRPAQTVRVLASDLRAVS